ncbi:hypothetical protein ABTK44_21240, partial [Acinetobacter baumannii]
MAWLLRDNVGQSIRAAPMPPIQPPKGTSPRKTTAALKATKPPGSEAKSVAKPTTRLWKASVYAPSIC